MGARAKKLDLMVACDRDREELERQAELLTPEQLAQAFAIRDNLIRIRGMLEEPYDPDVQEAGLANARAAISRSRLRVVDGGR